MAVEPGSVVSYLRMNPAIDPKGWQANTSLEANGDPTRLAIKLYIEDALGTVGGAIPGVLARGCYLSVSSI
jgi:hypothetical protein